MGRNLKGAAVIGLLLWMMMHCSDDVLGARIQRSDFYDPPDCYECHQQDLLWGAGDATHRFRMFNSAGVQMSPVEDVTQFHEPANPAYPNERWWKEQSGWRCKDSEGKPCEYRVILPTPSVPVDVPAIQEKYLAHKKGQSCDGEGVLGGLTHCEYSEDVYDYRPTCKDKSRVLLESEDGHKHCIQF